MKTAIEYFRSVIAEERMIQDTWNKTVDGKEYVCLAAAWGAPGTITSVNQCPVDLFPRWVFELMPTLDDGVAASDVPWLFQGFADRAEKMAAFAPAQWEAVRIAFMIGTIDVAVDAARSVQPSPAPAYWQQVLDAVELVKVALKTGDKKDLKAAYAAARAAHLAADLAARAAHLAADLAAYAAARAADLAADLAARAAHLEKKQAYKQIASIFFACVDSQIN